MIQLPETLQKLINSFKALPGIGSKTAERLAYYVVESHELYNEEFQLQAGWENRIEIWNLYPLLVHANLFGESYLNQINFILKKYN